MLGLLKWFGLVEWREGQLSEEMHECVEERKARDRLRKTTWKEGVRRHLMDKVCLEKMLEIVRLEEQPTANNRLTRAYTRNGHKTMMMVMLLSVSE